MSLVDRKAHIPKIETEIEEKKVQSKIHQN